MMKKLAVATLLICSISFSSCFYDKEDALYGSCSTADVTYSSTITGIIANHACLTCHSGNNPIAGFSLEGYTNVKAKVNDGRLFGAINHDSGFSPMPQNLPKLSQCDINKVKVWIDAGAPNN